MHSPPGYVEHVKSRQKHFKTIEVDTHTFKSAGIGRAGLKSSGEFIVMDDSMNPSRTRIDTQKYEEAAQRNLPSQEWNSAQDNDEIFQKHQSVISRIARGLLTYTFLYAIKFYDITKGSKMIHISEISNLLQDAIQDNWFPHLSGVTTAWTYVCLMDGIFGMHLEDSDALSFNVHVGGAGKKFWICILPESMELFEKVVRDILEKNESAGAVWTTCLDFMRHKSHYFTTSFLEKHNIKYTVVVQEEGDIVLTLPRCYHMGFNHGSSTHVAINMLCRWWIPFGIASKHVSIIC
jgi:hypothetical protein